MVRRVTESSEPSRRELLLGIAAGALGATALSAGGVSKVLATEKRPLIGMIPKYTSDPYFTAVRQGAEQACKELNCDLLFDGPATQDVTAQSDIVDLMVRKKVDALSICASDPSALAQAAKRAASRGVLVSSWDSDLDPSARPVFLNMASFDAISQTITDLMAKATDGGKGDFLLVTNSFTSTNMNHWREGIKGYAKLKYPDMVVKAELSGDADIEKSKNVTLDYLRSHPDTRGVIVIDGNAAAGAAEAVDQLGLRGKTPIAGIGVPSTIRPYIKSGTVFASVLWDPVDLGYGAIYISKAQLDKKLDPKLGYVEAGRLGKMKFVSEDVVLLGPPTVFTKENIDKYQF
jgi:rhamnose transport system substrate-binding protein